MSGGRWLRGLRPRLILAFTALTLVTAAATATATYVHARNLILDKVQVTLGLQVRETLTQLAPMLDHPLDEQGMTEIMEALDPPSSTDAVAVFLGGKVVHNDERLATAIPAELRRAVAGDRRLAWQRYILDGTPYLAVGTVLTGGGGPEPEVYVVSSLREEQAELDSMARMVVLIVGGALLLAVLLAVLSAGQVLRPVRELGRAARRMAGGDLQVRLRPRGNDELAELAATFNTTAATLDRTLRSARRFAADVSHELRTPLATMMAVAEVLEEESARLDDDLAEASRTVGAETRNLARLVEDLMEISRFDAGAATLSLGELDLATAVEACLRTRGWTDAVRTDLSAGVVASVDPRRFEVIVANLVGNALRHGAPPVEIALRREAEEVVITVTDHGPGLPDGLGERIFERFVKGDAARTRDSGHDGGSGLGLALAWENAHLHGGTLIAGRARDGGAEFTLRLPLDGRHA
ncbi:HAMP domain-containing sensor histidine kinase [Nonomuraea sp. NPDC050310]|uniref:HAMP domain-containing sensor histidine kinase n=1 Tax=Nonomuraea sp. NPDC050310 TaxID=3154935 RepID=UPI00340A22E9